MERNVGQLAVLALLDVAGMAAASRALRLSIQYQRTDSARNTAARLFLKHSTGPDDVLVMLDGDHVHPARIVPELCLRVDSDHEVVGALYFRRSPPYDPVY